MLNPAVKLPDVDPSELLARFVLFGSHIRNNQTVKPDVFIPYPHRDLSVTRHLEATELELWIAGEEVALSRSKPLLGRADTAAHICLGQKLTVVPDPIPSNPNHTNIASWPDDKAEQKLKAQELAATANYVQKP